MMKAQKEKREREAKKKEEPTRKTYTEEQLAEMKERKLLDLKDWYARALVDERESHKKYVMDRRKEFNKEMAEARQNYVIERDRIAEINRMDRRQLMSWFVRNVWRRRRKQPYLKLKQNTIVTRELNKKRQAETKEMEEGTSESEGYSSGVSLSSISSDEEEPTKKKKKASRRNKIYKRKIAKLFGDKKPSRKEALKIWNAIKK